MNSDIIILPKDVEFIIDRLEGAGFTACAAGGCVRDSLLGKEPTDWDIATNAGPEQVMGVFKGRRVLPTGIKHGTVTLFLRNVPYEITAFRVDGKYSDGRRPDSVTFTPNLTEDLSRRDFTINAMAYSPKLGLVDLFEGKKDLENKIIRCVGSPFERFSEDYLRIMRGYRFAAKLDFELDKDLKKAALELRERLSIISVERIRAELDKILLSGRHNKILEFMEDIGDVILPEVTALRSVPQKNSFHYLDVYGHTMEVFRYAKPTICQKLCGLLHDTGKAQALTFDENGTTHFHGHAKISEAIARDVLKRLKYDNAAIDEVTSVIREHNIKSGIKRNEMKRILNRLGEDKTRSLLDFCLADTMGKNDYSKAKDIPGFENDIKLMEDVLASGEPYRLSDLSVNGQDVMKTLGSGTGKAVGQALSYLLERVIDEPELNDRDKLLGMIKII